MCGSCVFIGVNGYYISCRRCIFVLYFICSINKSVVGVSWDFINSKGIFVNFNCWFKVVVCWYVISYCYVSFYMDSLVVVVV